MKHQTFMDILDLAWADFAAQDPDTAVGIIAIVVHKTEDDEMALQMGTTVAPQLVEQAFLELLTAWRDGVTRLESVARRPRRKVV